MTIINIYYQIRWRINKFKYKKKLIKLHAFGFNVCIKFAPSTTNRFRNLKNILDFEI